MEHEPLTPRESPCRSADRAHRLGRAWLPGLGLAALAWFFLRSGTKPSRITYPCQKAALSTASLAFGASALGALVVLRRWLRARLLSPAGLLLGALGVVAAATSWSWLTSADAPTGPVLSARADYRATVFHKVGCAQQPAGDHFPGLDDLLEMMGACGLKFYRSNTASLVAGPDGILAADDVVVVKINYQWPERGGTNTDLLRGLLARIVEHPDGFTGEIVVAENAQFNSTSNLDREANNAENTAQSPQDVVQSFKARGFRVSTYDWTLIRFTSVTEYAGGNGNDGYVVLPYDPRYLGRVSYPKFRSEYGARISLRRGLWTGSSYDRAHLKFLNVPVLKSHHSSYGATAAVKHYMGVVTGELNTNSHLGIGSGILGATIGEIGPADLNLLDATWINANPYSGPATSYGGATRKDMLVASTDPVALDIWAVKNILVPGFVENGYSPPWPTPSADPDDPSSAFRRYLDRSMNFILEKGYQVTNDLAAIDLVNLGPPGAASDPRGVGAPFTIARQAGGYALAWSAPVRGGAASEYQLYRTDLARAQKLAAPECEAPLGDGTTAFLPDLPANHGFLVVARNAAGDGSLGSDGAGRERPSPAAGSACP
ncbi:MAG: DUF362 domain-containing protein [Acidobacteria bacterium]|nr:DUF362 domain-containing protein [Acidobacteriota bacterium]